MNFTRTCWSLPILTVWCYGLSFTFSEVSIAGLSLFAAVVGRTNIILVLPLTTVNPSKLFTVCASVWLQCVCVYGLRLVHWERLHKIGKNWPIIYWSVFIATHVCKTIILYSSSFFIPFLRRRLRWSTNKTHWILPQIWEWANYMVAALLVLILSSQSFRIKCPNNLSHSVLLAEHNQNSSCTCLLSSSTF